MEDLVFKKKIEKVWMKAEYNSIKNFFEVSHSLFSAFSSFIHFVSHPLRKTDHQDQASSLFTRRTECVFSL